MQNKKKILYLITKSYWGENENCFAFSPVRRYAEEQPMASETRKAVGGPTQLRSNFSDLLKTTKV